VQYVTTNAEEDTRRTSDSSPSLSLGDEPAEDETIVLPLSHGKWAGRDGGGRL
jgi:hypothetical protein